MRFSERELYDDVVYALYEIKPTLTLIWLRCDTVTYSLAVYFTFCSLADDRLHKRVISHLL